MTTPQQMLPDTVETLVRLQVIRVYDIRIQHRPDQDPVAIVESGELQTTVITEYGTLKDVERDAPEVWDRTRPLEPDHYQPGLYFGHLPGSESEASE